MLVLSFGNPAAFSCSITAGEGLFQPLFFIDTGAGKIATAFSAATSGFTAL
ncbi:hypothetical protein [Aliirhizobium smilacinae]|uniref:hypothetical protein n=1 Tax=Aliirhizobium smilacinae TaxID=1395944 RepID=UPI0015D57CAA|nr:hypothetical protein [Rhizobium smilacinae]